MESAGGRRARTDRGRRRKTALLDAAADLLNEHGFAALTHRALAERAGLPTSATTYYFSSIDDLHDQALRHLADRWLQRATAGVERLPPHLAGDRAAAAIVDIVTATASETGHGDGDLLVMYERYLEAGRHPHLRGVVKAYNDHVIALILDVLRRGGMPADPDSARLLLAVVDGSIISSLAEGIAPASAARDTVVTVLALLDGARRPPAP